MKKQKNVKGVDETFLDSINNCTVEELKSRIVQLQLQNEENELFKESEAYMKAKAEFDYAKEQFDLVVGPVRETTTVIKNRTKAIIDRLKEKGGA